MARPPVLTVKKLVALAPGMVQAIEDFRYLHRIPSEAEAIRRLLALGLTAAAGMLPLPDQSEPR